MKRTPIIVVTGAIASGKSTVAEILAGGGGTLIQADQLAHKALEMDDVIDSIRMEFGDRAITESGTVSRGALGSIVLNNREEMEKLNSIVEPAVTGIINRAVEEAAVDAEYIVLDAVLFFKYTFQFREDLVIAAEASEETRIQRLMRRNGLTREEAESRVAAQRYLYPGWERCDMRIDTDRGLRQLKAEVADMRNKILGDLI
ncbi:MAG: dephospho-CoA kinase [Candidatus Krumholzibacteriota bacterium]